jgi:L-fuculose-phosphate aldolase
VELSAEMTVAVSGSTTTTAWSLRQQLTIACRTLANDGHTPTLAGQVTARNPSTDTIIAPPIHLAFSEVTPVDFVEVDQQFNTVGGSAKPNPATRFHLWVYRSRPDVNAIVHTHPPYVSALSLLGRPLVAAHMDSMALYKDCAYLPDWPGVPVADEEGRIIAAALGDKRSILLGNHGMLTAGKNVAEALYLAWAVERTAFLQMTAEAVGNIQPIDADHARKAHDFLLQDSLVGMGFEVAARRIHRMEPGCLAE